MVRETIAIDPGHGGADEGVKGAAGTKEKDLTLAIARRVKAARDAGFVTHDGRGRPLNGVKNIGTLGGATLDNEENYLIKKLFSAGLGVLSVENQARI